MPKVFGNTETSELPYAVRIMCHWRNIALQLQYNFECISISQKNSILFSSEENKHSIFALCFLQNICITTISVFYIGNHTNYGTCFFPADEQTHSRDLSCTEALRENEEILLSTSNCYQLALPWLRRIGENQDREPNASFISVCLASVCFPCLYFSDFPWDKAWPCANTAATLLEAKRTASIIMQMSRDYKCKDFMWLEKLINEVLTYAICSPFPPPIHPY